MKTIEAQIPEPILRQAEELAEREHLPLTQVISMAVAQGVGTWNYETVAQSNAAAVAAKRADRERFLDALTDALNGELPRRHILPRWYG
jgi:hypothetical protein